MKKNKAFTLIELIAVLVLMAILALIVTPLVMNIIRKARTAADKRSIDAYGRSIEIAIAGYLLDNGTFPTSIDELTIEYIGDQVVCETIQLNSDSSVYLAGCKVGGRTVENYIYGTEETITYDAYEVGDEISYNNVDYYVIKATDETESTVTLLKAEPLTTSEVNEYGAGHINRYTYESVGTAYNQNGYGGIAYYSNETCGYVNNTYVRDGCKTEYESSDIKYVVDAWKVAQAPLASEARLITYDELTDNLGYKKFYDTPKIMPSSNGETPVFVSDTEQHTLSNYWTMSPFDSRQYVVWFINYDGYLSFVDTGHGYGGYSIHVNNTVDGNDNESYSKAKMLHKVRPVIVLDKSLLTNQ